MTRLKDLLLHRIRSDGPMSVAAYMAECLLHPDHGYYTTRLPFGGSGDFTTAPEISQMFGELLGLALARSWLDQGAPDRFTLAEFGPGRGTLMADVLRATRGVPGFHAAMQIVLMEASPLLRAVQKTTLASYAVHRIDQADDLPDQPLFLLANEFFDALPIRQFVRSVRGWHERLIGETDGRLGFGLSPPIPADAFDLRFVGDPPETLVELCPAATIPIQVASDRIRRHGGVALIADYGGWRSKGDTLQALRSHAFADPLEDPGKADLTAHVDFEALVLASGLGHAYADQGKVLKTLGIEARAHVLAGHLSGQALDIHFDAVQRLTGPHEMGELFKILALFPKAAPMPPGFSDA